MDPEEVALLDDRATSSTVQELVSKLFGVLRRLGMSYSSPVRINTVATVRCTSMRDGVRCVFMQGHSGRHHDGEWLEWNDAGERVAAKDRCSSVAMAYEAGFEVRCELPKGHRSAHRGSDLIWGDPVTLEAPPSKRWGESPYQVQDNR